MNYYSNSFQNEDIEIVELAPSEIVSSEQMWSKPQDNRGTFHPDVNRKISRMPAYLEIIRESERKKLIEKKHMAGQYMTNIKHIITAVIKKIFNPLLKAVLLYRNAGLETNEPTNEEIIAESKILCREYINHKLKRTGVLTEEMRQTLVFSASSETSEELRLVGEELENMYPDLYRNVHKQLNITFHNEDIVKRTYTLFAEQLCKSGLNWGKIIALFAMAGAFAVDCVKQNHPELVPKITDAFGSFVALRLTDWIAQQGGWIIPEISRQKKGHTDNTWFWILSTVGFLVVFIATLLVTIAI